MSLSSSHTYTKLNNDKLLGEQLDWLTVDHDDLRQDLFERISTPKYHPSMAIIDQWEAESIACIQQTAILARRTLIDALDQHVIEVKRTLDNLTPILREARDGLKAFNENDIQRWADILHELKQIPKYLVLPKKNNCHCSLTIDLRKEGQNQDLLPNKTISCHSLSIIRDYPSSISVKTNENNSKDIQINHHSQTTTSTDFPIYSKIQRPSRRSKKIITNS